MLLHAYSLFDTKALIFSPPFFMSADALAIRAVQDLAADLTTSVGRHPNDFVLHRVGTFNDATGRLDPELPENLGVAASFLVNDHRQTTMFKEAVS